MPALGPGCVLCQTTYLKFIIPVVAGRSFHTQWNWLILKTYHALVFSQVFRLQRFNKNHHLTVTVAIRFLGQSWSVVQPLEPASGAPRAQRPRNSPKCSPCGQRLAIKHSKLFTVVGVHENPTICVPWMSVQLLSFTFCTYTFSAPEL